MTRVTLVMGSGGVGKTSVAAGLGGHLALQGRRTLVVTVDPARRLAAAMGVTLGHDPGPVPGLPGLDAAMLDATAAWDGIARSHADPATARRLLANPYFRAVAERFPSGQAYAAGEELLRRVEEGGYDEVVVDTPPGEAGAAFLAAPHRIRALVAGRALRLLTGPRMPGRRLVYSLTARPALAVADAILGGRLLRDIAEFLLDLSAIYPTIARRSKRVEALLAGADMVVVTTPERGPVAEARRLVAPRRGAATTVVFNRMLPAAWAGSPPAGDAAGATLHRWGLEAERQQSVLRSFGAQTGITPPQIPWVTSAPAAPRPLAELVAAAGLRPLS